MVFTLTKAILWQNGSPSHNYASITNEREHLPSTKPKGNRSEASGRRKLSLVNRRTDGAANMDKPGNSCEPPRLNPPNIDIGQGLDEGTPKKARHAKLPPRPDPPSGGAKQAPTDGRPREVRNVHPPPRPDPPSAAGGRGQIDSRLRQIGHAQLSARLDPPSGSGSRGPTDGRRMQLGDVLRTPRLDPPVGDSSRESAAGRPVKLGDVLCSPRPDPPSNLRGRRLNDSRRKQQFGDILRPQRLDPLSSIGKGKVNEDSSSSAESSCRNEIKDTTKIDNSPKKVSGSSVKKPATIKLPKRRSSIQKTTEPQQPDVKSRPVSGQTEGNRIAAVKQRLFEMQNGKKRESRKVSIPISKSEGNVAKKTRSLEDKLFAGAGLAPTLFPLFVKPKKNLPSVQGGKPTIEHSLSVGSCAYSCNFDEFFNS